MNNSITILGDVHGKYRRMHEIIRDKNKHEYIVQIGDFGFDFSTLDNVDSNKFKIIGGNHDNYNKIIHIPHYLGDYGYTSLNKIEFFYYRGAYSIDRQYRTIGIDWWEDEQVSIDQFMKARVLYRETKPDVVISHDCPEIMVTAYIGNTGRIYQNTTSWALNELFNIHQPKLWIHGHYHVNKTTVYGNTKFVCLDELGTYSIM